MSFGPIIYNNMLPHIWENTHVTLPDGTDQEKYIDMSPIMYFLFKIPRYVRIFEMQSQVADILEYYSHVWTVFEIRKMQHNLDILQFTIETIIAIHILTCTMWSLCIHRDYDKSWMAVEGVDKSDIQEQYIISIYFVTTTLSTCGFGDIGPNPTDY